LASGRKDGKKTAGPGLSTASVSYAYRVLHKALKQAVEWQLLPRNPADHVKAPREKAKPVAPLTAEQVTRLLDALRGTYVYLPALLAVHTGMRLGEILGLHIVGPHASDLILEGTLAINLEATLEEIDTTIHAHPTLGEAIVEAALAAQGRALHVPAK